MLIIKDLYKEKKNQFIKELNLSVLPGTSVSIECSNELSALLFDLILTREIPAKGDIIINGLSNNTCIHKHMDKIGIIPREDAYYEELTVLAYIKLFAQLLNSSLDYMEIMQKTAIADIGDMKIKKLTFSQKRKVSLARERLKNPKLFLCQEPIWGLDQEDAKIIIENFDDLCMEGCAVLITSVYLRDALLAGKSSYRLDRDGFINLNHKEIELVKECSREDLTEEKPVENISFKIEKIPSKIEDKILLFDPMEIDYVESQQGGNLLYIRGEKFPCNLSLTELEERLKHLGFFRCHRSYLANLQRVREVITWSRNSYSLILDDKNKSTLPLAKGRLEELKVILRL